MCCSVLQCVAVCCSVLQCVNQPNCIWEGCRGDIWKWCSGGKNFHLYEGFPHSPTSNMSKSDHRYKVAKTHRMTYLCASFSAKEPYDWWPFCGKTPAIQGILCIFATLYECVTSLVWMSYVSHMNEWCHTCMHESCHTYEWVMSRIWMSHFTRMNESCHTYEWVISHVWMSHVTHMNESCHTYEWVMP